MVLVIFQAGAIAAVRQERAAKFGEREMTEAIDFSSVSLARDNDVLLTEKSTLC